MDARRRMPNVLEPQIKWGFREPLGIVNMIHVLRTYRL